MRNYIIILIYILTLSTGQLLWKLSMNQTGEFMAGGVQTLLASLGQLLSNVYFLLGSVAYAVATVLWFHLLSRFEFSYIYPFTALLYPISLGGSILFLRETVPVERWIGVGIICIGVVLIGKHP